MNLFFRQLQSELRKLFARRRTYLGFGAFLLIEILLLFILIQAPKVRNSLRHLIEKGGYVFERYFSGLTLGLMVVTWTIVLLGGLYLALVAGDVVAKEVEDGTMRMVLCRPVSRVRLLLIKYCSCVIYTFCLILFIGLTALAAGLIRQGPGGLFVADPWANLYAMYEFWPGLARYLGALGLLSVSMVSFTSLGFALSCFKMKPAAATIITLSVFFLDSIFHNIPYFESLRPWFLSTHMSTWMNIFRPEVPVWKMIEDYGILFGVNVTFVVVGIAAFQQRDLKA